MHYSIPKLITAIVFGLITVKRTSENLTTRTIYNYPYDKHIHYNELKLLYMKKINTLHILIYMYKYKNNLLPSSFDNLIKSKTPEIM